MTEALLFSALEEHFHDINQDLVEECLGLLKSELSLTANVKSRLLENPSLVLFKLALAMGMTFDTEEEANKIFALISKSDNSPNFMCYFLQMLSSYELSPEQWQKILNMNNLIVCRHAVSYGQRCLSVEAKERLLLGIDYSSPLALLFAERLLSPEIQLTLPPTVSNDTHRSTRELLDAIRRAISYGYDFSGCSCSKHYECHDY